VLLRDSIYQAIRRAILTCEFEPGQELREQTLAERYDVSRSPIRDSLLRLEQEYLVTVKPRQGYCVRPISSLDIEDILSLRLLIEPGCAVAAAQADDTALRSLDRFRDFMDQDYSDAGFVEYNASFHRVIAELPRNLRLVAIASDVIDQFARLDRLAVGTGRRDAAVLSAEHEAIIDALQAHDPERASRLCHEHVEREHAFIMAALRLKGGSLDTNAEPNPDCTPDCAVEVEAPG
jgi:GntR family transcriptional regulator, rspAB operon transcriptional repressor